MSNEELVEMIKKQKDTSRNIEQLWQQNRGFIAKLARQYCLSAEMDDLMQEGFIGLFEAVDNYDPKRGMNFISYSAFYIRRRMNECVRKNGSIIYPVHLFEKYRVYKRTISEYQKLLDCEPSDQELSSILGVSIDKVQEMKKISETQEMKRLDSPTKEYERKTVLEFVPCEEMDLDRKIDLENMSIKLHECIKKIGERKRSVIEKIFFENKDGNDIANEMGISYCRINELKREALKEFRKNKSEYQGLRSYYDIYLRTGCKYRNIGVNEFKTTWTSQPEKEVIRKLDLEEENRIIQELAFETC